MSNGQTTLITGGTGFLGTALVRYLLSQDVRRVVVFSHSDERQRAMRANVDDDRLQFWLGDVRDARALRRALLYHNVDQVIHTAAIKSVTTCELFPLEAAQTNVTGTANVIDLAEELGLFRVLTISSDKALNPTGVYGASKAMLERMTVASGFSAIRCGNLIGSTGSVLPVWRKQIEAGEPITVTDPAMTRFYMSVDDAVAFIIAALAAMRGGEIFVPKLKACQLSELARAVSASQTIIGPRPGERVHEALLLRDELVIDAGWAFVVKSDGKPFTGVYRSDQVERLDPRVVLELV